MDIIMKKVRICIILILTPLLLFFLDSCSTSRKNVTDTKHRQDVTTIHTPKPDKKQKQIVKEAMEWLGTPYAYAKSDKGSGTDCSGMVLQVYLTVFDIKLPRNSAKQAEFCEQLEAKEVKIGDLAFFATGKDPERISHVGIMIDDVNFIHASTSKGVVISRIDTPYYIRTFKMFGRVPGSI